MESFNLASWLLIGLAAVIIGISKGGIPGVGIIAPVLMADIFTRADASTGFVLPMLIFADIIAVYYYKRHAEIKYIKKAMPWAITGVLIGFTIMYQGKSIDGFNAFLKVAIGLIVLAILAMSIYREANAERKARKDASEKKKNETDYTDLIGSFLWDYFLGSGSSEKKKTKPKEKERESGILKPLLLMSLGGLMLKKSQDIKKEMAEQNEQEKERLPVWMAPFLGITGGIATMMANAAGPIFIIYVLSLGFSKRHFMGTLAWIFLLLNLFKVPLQIILGHITLETFSYNLMLLPAILTGCALGIFFMHRIPEKAFLRLIQILTALACFKLIFF